MELFYAPYAALEKSFLRYVKEQRRRPLEPWLVVCSSSALAKRLRDRLARGQGAVANIHFYTASALLYQLDQEAGPSLPVFPQDHIRDFLLKEILTQPGLNRYPVSRGFVQALKESLRDLADSLADPEVLEEQLQSVPEELAGQEQERFAWLVAVYKQYLQREAQLPGYRPYQALFERAVKQVGSSAFLRGFTKIVFYGFYDMSGRLLELMHQIRSFYEPVVFAPYGKHPAYQFARKFFETNWLGPSGGGTDEADHRWGALGASGAFVFADRGEAPAPGVEIIPAADIAGEVNLAAKEILRLVEEEHYALEDIGVLVRTPGEYQDEVRRLFAQHAIALNASFQYPLARFPLGVFCFNLFLLAANGFDRESVLALLSSPYFKHPRRQAWRALAEKSLVSLHMTQWQDLLPQTEGFDPDFLAWLETCQRQLDVLACPGPWAQKVMQARRFLTDNLDEKSLQGKELEIYHAVCTCIDSLAQYEQIRPQAKAGELLGVLAEALSGLSFHDVQAAPRGVVFTDVQRARGLSFRAVFLLGMNEKIFPQLLPEDPILKDRYRYILRDVLGYWISQKAERVDEEKLLFFTAVTAAEERLYVSYACRGADGKERVPSVYVAELARACCKAWTAEQKPRLGGSLSRQLLGTNPLFWTPQEVSNAIVLYGKDAVSLYQRAGLYNEQVSHSLHAAARINSSGAAGEFDGFIQSGEAVFENTRQNGFSPSALQDLATCPMKYFFNRVLRLDKTQDTYSRHELAADKRGTAYHAVLEDFYRELNRLGLTHQLFDSGVTEYIERALSRHYTEQSYRLFGIYPLVWKLILEDMRARLVTFAQEDVKQLGAFIPTYFEREFAALAVAQLPFHLRGIIDRIDVDKEHKTFRVVDYKSSRKGTKDLGKVFFTHLIFQPFLYVFAAQQMPELKGFSLDSSCLLSLAPSYDCRALLATQWQALGPQACRFLSQLAEVVQKGQFFLNPSENCAYCPYGDICRKDSFRCLMRARKSAPSQQIEEARYAVQ